MIDKIQPRKLDKDSDLKLVQKTSMIDALNVYIDESLSGTEGNAGVLKPILGTDEIPYLENDISIASPESFRVLGSVTDETTNVVYYFVWHSDAQGVFAYDPDGVLPTPSGESFVAGDSGKIREVLTTPVFNFHPNSFIKADIIYSTRSRPDVADLPQFDAIIYFTDGISEPKKLNVYRAMINKTAYEASGNEVNTYDFLCACPKVPMGNIDYEFVSDDAVAVSNFENTSGFQFAIQGVYYDGSTTAIGPYSDIAFPASVVNRGARPVANTLQHNLCKIFVPNLPSEIQTVKILARQGNSQNFVEITEVPNEGEGNDANWVNSEVERCYKFYNDKVALGVSSSEVSKIFDNVPRASKMQAAVSNRMVYGNFKEGYDVTDISASVVPVYKDRPSEGVDFSINAVPSIIQDQDETNASGPFNLHSGFELDMSEIPDEIVAESTIEFSVTMNPANNFHVYDSRKSYHQTRAKGWSMSDLRGYPTDMGNFVDGQINPRTTANVLKMIPEGSPAWYQEKGGGYSKTSWDNATVAAYDIDPDLGGSSHSNVSGYNNDRHARNFFGRNYGVGYNEAEGALPPVWESRNKSAATKSTIASYGSSAAAPLILKGGAVSFKLKVKTIEAVPFNGPNVLRQVMTALLGGDENPYPDTFEVIENQREFDYEIDLQLSNKQILNSGSPFRDLIVAAGNCGQNADTLITNVDNMAEEIDRSIPMGYFIVNKATVSFSLQSEEGSTNRGNLALSIDDIVVPADGIFTCVRKADPGSPWWVLSPDEVDAAIDSGENPPGIGSWSDRVFDGTENSFSFRLGRWLIPDNDEVGQGSEQVVTIGDRFIGRLKWYGRDGEGFRDFWPCKGGKFKFSILDGAAGPGGLSPGDQSAWASYGGGSQGSVTGQVIFTHFGCYDVSNTSSEDAQALEADLYKDIYSLVPLTKDRRSSILVGGQLLQKDTNGLSAANFRNLYFPDSGVGQVINVARANASGIPSDRVIKDEQIGLDNQGNSNSFPAVAVFAGPFFTGRINLNPIISPPEGGDLEDVENAVRDSYNLKRNESSGETNVDTVAIPNTYEFLNGGMTPGGINDIERSWLPPAPDQTTVLPYVMYTDITDKSRENFKLFRQSYPFPILDQDAVDQVTQDVDNGIIDSSSLFNDLDIALNPDPFGYADMTGANYNDNHQGFAGISYRPRADEKRPHIDITRSQTSTSVASGKPIMSFKSSATHEFGLVYFDERGRRGPVNPLGSFFVPGYGDRPNNEGGPVFASIQISSDPPSWAHHYKVVYSKNTTVSDFFQYSTEGAYSVLSDDQDKSGGKIYVSLNYLQGHPISYSDAWGARSQDGSPVVFQPEQGDKLRVLSYNTLVADEQEKNFPSSIEFDVVGIESLGSDNNPLIDSSLDPIDIDKYRSKQGLFLVLRDNPEASGFNLFDIRSDNSLWGNNVIFEIYRPIKEIDSDKRLYFEIGPTFAVGKNEDGSLFHMNQENVDGPIEISQGDVFFRLTAVNQKTVEEGQFVNLIKEDIQVIEEQVDADGNTVEVESSFSPESEPNFLSIYTESSSASDLFSSEATSQGRPAKIDRNARERDRISSLIHSDRDIQNSKKLGYSSFNPSQADDKDLDVVRGAINYMASIDDAIFCIQDSKVSNIPVDRNIISTADNEPSLISSSEVLGTPRFFASDAGSDSPESVASSDNAFFFADKKTGKVFRFSGSNGVMCISDKGMKAYFRNLLSSLSSSDKVIGGFDPKKEEYLLTVRQDDATYTPNGVVIDQSNTPVQVFGESAGADISINIFDLGIPEDLQSDPRFTSTAQVSISHYWDPCCDETDEFSPVAIAINAIAADQELGFEITDDIRLYLDYAYQQQSTTDTYALRAGEINTVITNSIRAQGFPDVAVAPFSSANGDNLYYEFLTDCNAQDDSNRIYKDYDLVAWATNVWGAPQAYNPATSGTGFLSESFITEVSQELANKEICSISYSELANRWQQVSNGAAVPWDADGTMKLHYVTSSSSQELIDEFGLSGYAPSNWSVFNDGGGVYPARIDSAQQMAALLSDGTPGGIFPEGLQVPVGVEQFGIPTVDLAAVLGDFYVSYIGGGGAADKYPVALFQVHQELREALATYLDVAVATIPGLYRVNGYRLKTWQSVQDGAAEDADTGGGGV